MNSLFRKKNSKRQAHEVLEALNLLHFLSKYGRPKIVGSVALGLMTWRDIDIDLEITGEVNDQDFWQTAQYQGDVEGR